MALDRRLLAAGALCLLLVTAGCAALSPGGGDVDQERLEENATYDWNTSADVTIDVTGEYYHAVYQVEDRSTIGLSRFHRLNNRRPLEVGALAFRYPNGTVVGAEEMHAEQNRSYVTVTLPAEEGQFGYRVPHRGKQLQIATAVEGSYEVIIPPETRVRYPMIGRVVPDGYTTSTEDGRVHVRWTEVTANRLVVRYYLVRDLWIFAGLLTIASVTAIVGLAYYWLQLQGLRERRQSVDLERGGR